MHGWIGVEPPDQRQELRFARLLRQPVVEGAHAAAGGHFHLASDVTLARRVVADEHDGQSRRDTAVARKAVHGIRDLAAQVRRDRLPVNDLCGHGVPPCAFYKEAQ